jgi:hypothetical protein
MARQKCAACGQFASTWHKCPHLAAVPTSARAVPLRARTKTAAPAKNSASYISTAPRYAAPSIPLGANPDYFALATQMERALTPATNESARMARDSIRKALEAQFGSIDWRAKSA